MKTLFCIVIVALSGNCLVGQDQIPSAVSVTSGESPKLVPGQSFKFTLQFDKAPEGYGGGKISYQFDNVAISGRSVNDQDSVSGGEALHDGQSIYSFSLPITESMDKGRWKLVSVQMGKAVMRDVQIPDDVVFDVPLPPPILHVRVPEKVVAGTSFHLGVTLDEIPIVPPQCSVFIGFFIRPPVQVSVSTADNVLAQSGRHSYELTGKLDVDVPSGVWKGAVNLYTGPKEPAGDPGRMCFEKLPPWLSSSQLSLTVEPSPSLVSPTAVSARVNPSQIQLLVAEADRLRAKAKHLQEQLTSGNETGNQDLLRSSLLEANADLDKTEATFKQQGVEESLVQEVDAFFDDIRFGYREALGILRGEVARGKDSQLLRVSAGRAGAPLNAGRVVLKSIRRNAHAYDVVASTTHLTFTLEVYSEPKGATISYRTRGGEYHSVDHATDWNIENLVRAVWLIRLQKPGYKDAEETFDAIDNTRTSITISLTRK
jgi:hypothetical protein